jgi:hypothetical protein
MTLEKIKHHLSPVIFEYWSSLHKATECQRAVEQMKQAKDQLQNEVEAGIRENNTQTVAEISLLKHLLTP